MGLGIGIDLFSFVNFDYVIKKTKKGSFPLIWEVSYDDELTQISKVLSFLHNEYPVCTGSEIWSEEYFHWKLGNLNPSGTGFLSLATHNGSVIGTASLTKKRIIIDGIKYIAGEVGDTYTSPKIIRRGKPSSTSALNKDPKSYINRSVFGRLITETVHRAMLNNVKFIYGTPNSNSFPGYTKRLGFIEYENYSNITYYRPSINLISKKLSFLNYVLPLFKFLEKAVLTSQRTSFYFLRKNITLSNKLTSEDTINALWRLNKPETGFSLIRDYQYWYYRYCQHPLANYQFFSVFNRGNLSGIVVCREFRTKHGYNSVAIVEWMLDKEITLSYLISEILYFYKSKNIDYFYFWGSSSSYAQKSAIKNFFWIKKQAPIIFFNNELAKGIVNKRKELKFFLGSSDAI